MPAGPAGFFRKTGGVYSNPLLEDNALPAGRIHRLGFAPAVAHQQRGGQQRQRPRSPNRADGGRGKHQPATTRLDRHTKSIVIPAGL